MLRRMVTRAYDVTHVVTMQHACVLVVRICMDSHVTSTFLLPPCEVFLLYLEAN